MSKTIKNIIIFVVILIVVIIVYFVVFGKKDAAPAGQTNSGLQSSSGAPVTGITQTSSPSSVEASKIGQEFINQLLNLQAIKLNDEVFSSLSFQSLEDFTIILVQPGNEGRPNPFAPFGADGASLDTANIPGITESDLNVTPINELPPVTNGNSLPPDLTGS